MKRVSKRTVSAELGQIARYLDERHVSKTIEDFIRSHDELLGACEAARDALNYAGVLAGAKSAGLTGPNGEFPLYDRLHRAIMRATREEE